MLRGEKSIIHPKTCWSSKIGTEMQEKREDE